MKRMVLLLFGVIGFFLLGTIAQAEKPFTMRIGFLRISAQLPVYAAADLGFFAQEGLDVKLNAISPSPRIIEAISGGSLEAGIATATTIAMLRDRGFDFVIFSGQTFMDKIQTKEPPGYRDASPVIVPADSPIKKPKDLEGKKVAVMGLKIVNWVYMAEWLARNGANPKKVNWVEIPFPHMGRALARRLVDAVNVAEPFSTIILSQGKTRSIGSPFSAISDDVILGTWVARKPWLDSHKKQAQAFSRAIGRAIDYMNKNPDKRVKLLLKHIKMSPAVAKKMVWFRWNRAVRLESLQAQADLAFKWGLIKKKLDAREFLYETAR